MGLGSNQEAGTKTCKHCQSEIPAKAKICPNCRKKQGGKGLFIILGIVAVVIICAALAGGNDSKEDSAVQSAEESSNKDDKSSDETKKEADKEEKIEYTSYDFKDLIDELNDNALKAEKDHQDEYVEVTGYLTNIDSDGNYINLGAAEDDYDYMFDSITCDISDDSQSDAIMDMKKYDKIVVKGKITSIGEVVGYTIELDEISVQ